MAEASGRRNTEAYLHSACAKVDTVYVTLTELANEEVSIERRTSFIDENVVLVSAPRFAAGALTGGAAVTMWWTRSLDTGPVLGDGRDSVESV